MTIRPTGIGFRAAFRVLFEITLRSFTALYTGSLRVEGLALPVQDLGFKVLGFRGGGLVRGFKIYEGFFCVYRAAQEFLVWGFRVLKFLLFK